MDTNRPREFPDYARSKDSNALININKGAFEAYRANRNRSKQVKQLEAEVNSLRGDVTEIKDMLQTLVKNLGQTNG